MHTLSFIQTVLLSGACVINRASFYSSLDICTEILTDKQQQVFARLHKRVCIAHRTNTIKFRIGPLSRETLLITLEIDATEKVTAEQKRIMTLLSDRKIIETKPLLKSVRLSHQEMKHADKRAFQKLHTEIKCAHRKQDISNRIDDLTVKTLMLMHNTRNNYNHP